MRGFGTSTMKRVHVRVILALPDHQMRAVTISELAGYLKIEVATVEKSLHALRSAYLAVKQNDRWNLTHRGLFFRHSLLALKLVKP